MNDKYRITDMEHPEYPFLHRIQALREINDNVSAGDLGGYVESEANLSFEPGDSAWIYDDAICCGDAYVANNSELHNCAVACDSAYITNAAVMLEASRAEDDSYLSCAMLTDHACISGMSMVQSLPDDGDYAPTIAGTSRVYGRVIGDVTLYGSTVVMSSETIENRSLDTLVLNHGVKSIVRAESRDVLAPRRVTKPEQTRKPKQKGRER